MFSSHSNNDEMTENGQVVELFQRVFIFNTPQHSKPPLLSTNLLLISFVD